MSILTQFLSHFTQIEKWIFCSAGVEYDVYIENYRLQELDKALKNCTLRLVDVNLLRMAKFANITRTINP